MNNPYQIARAKALKEEAPKKALEELFDKPPQPSKGTTVAVKLEELKQQIAELQKQRDMLLSKERAAAIEDINEKIELFDITVKDLDFPSVGKTSSKAKVAVKYKNGSNVWTGRGRQPKWVADHIAQGGKLEDLLVK